MNRTPLSVAIRAIVNRGDYRQGHLYADVVGPAEKGAIEAALEKCRGNQSHAALLLGINRNTLRTRARALGVKL